MKTQNELKVEYIKRKYPNVKENRLVEYVKDIDSVVELSHGLFAIKKPFIETRFCFSFDEVQDCHCGTDTYGEALKSASNVQEKLFIKENIKRNAFDFQENLKKYSFGYTVANFADKSILEICYGRSSYALQAAEDGRAWELSESDVQALIKAFEEARERFIKRLKTYWKRYGNTKLKTWTYSAND